MAYNIKSKANLIPFNTRDTQELREISKKGGLASAVTRRRKAEHRKTIQAYMRLYDYFDNLSDAETKEVLQEYTEEQQKKIKSLFNLKD